MRIAKTYIQGVLTACVYLTTWLVCQRASAESYGATASVMHRRESITDSTATLTSVNTRTAPKAFTAMHDLLLEVPGVRPISFGGWSQYTVLNLRGADADHTQVLWGDIPISAPDGGAVDLSTIPVFLSERIDVFRGGAPTWLGSGSIGGVVRIVPREDNTEVAHAQTGIASYGTASTQGSVSLKPSWLLNDRLQVSAGTLRSDGGFRYRDNLGTTLDPTDDVDVTQRNGALRTGFGMIRYRANVRGYTIEWLSTLFARRAPALRSFDNVHTFFARILSAAHLDKTSNIKDIFHEPWWRIHAVATYQLERRRLSDPYNSVGLGAQSSNDTLHRFFGRLGWSSRINSWMRTTALATWTHDRFSPHDAVMTAVPEGKFSRDALGTSAEAQINHTSLGLPTEWRLSIRNEWNASRFPTASKIQIAPTLRLAGRFSPTRSTHVNASIASGIRLANMLELFGDRGFTEGNLDLRPETSRMADLGMVQHFVRGKFALHVESRIFLQSFSDLIRYIRTSQRTAKPQNIASATNVGLEAGVQGSWRLDHQSDLRWVTQLTWQNPRDPSGRLLPYRPQWQWYARPSFAWRNVSAYFDISYLGTNYQDSANIVGLAPRTLVGCGGSVAFFGRRAELMLSVRDLFDARPFEVVGFPLPGRTFAATLTLRSE